MDGSFAVSSVLANRRWELYSQHHASIARTARRLLGNVDDARDLVQEVSIRVLNHPTGPRAEECFQAWCYGLLRNAAADFRRSSNRRGQYHELVGDIEEYAANDSTIDPELSTELRQQLTERLGELDDFSYQLLVRRYLYGETAAEIARNLSCSPPSVRMRLGRLRSKLRRVLRTVSWLSLIELSWLVFELTPQL